LATALTYAPWFFHTAPRGSVHGTRSAIEHPRASWIAPWRSRAGVIDVEHAVFVVVQVTGVPGPVGAGIGLIGVRRAWAVVDEIGDAVAVVIRIAAVAQTFAVEIRLVAVGDERAVVNVAAHPVTVCVVGGVAGTRIAGVEHGVAVSVAGDPATSHPFVESPSQFRVPDAQAVQTPVAQEALLPKHGPAQQMPPPQTPVAHSTSVEHAVPLA
jgi:hypothetical protein